MTQIKIIFLVFNLILLLTGCLEDIAAVDENNYQVDENPDDVDESTDVVKENKTIIPENTINADLVEDYDIAAANNAFAFDMYSHLTQPETGKYENILFSPHSISTAMAICYEGAENTTKEQISNVFYFPTNKTVLRVGLKETNDKINSGSDDYELETANALWVQEDYPIKEEYIIDVKNYYDGEVTNLDFVEKTDDSIDAINEWVEDKTNNKIKNLASKDSITADTRVIITNAIYFNEKWTHAFDKELTEKRAFYPAEGKEISVDTMYMATYFIYGENSEAKIIELPYKGNKLSMYIVLPKDNDIEKFETEFTLNNYIELKNEMEFVAEVKTSIPKFKFETKTELSDSLIEMGVEDAFGQANFSGISDSPLSLSRVIHQTFIDVKEEGTEAAAATLADMEMGIVNYDTKEFKADHPFMFFIEDRRTNCILFMGKVEYPEYEETEEF